MRKIIGFITVFLILTGCQEKDQEAPVLSLRKSRVQIALNTSFDYLQYVKKAYDHQDGDVTDQISYNEIDTSSVGKKTVHYKVTDQAGNQSQKDLIVDVVEYVGDLINPITAKADIVENPDDVTVLVNKLHEIPKGWKPDDLEDVIDCHQQLRHEANEAYTKFYQAAKAKGIAIYTISGYREPETQQLYWDNSVKVFGEEHAIQYNAYPRRSEHELGLCVDISYTTEGDRLSEKVADSALGKFIESDAYKYGFILRYPQDKVRITGYSYEPWHIRYVGVDLATKLHNENITLEEYYEG
ncbi:D-alanyl-D-alanine carboxypeptidase family protein [Massilimicrobiota timonensis]|uniref:D-alanyl-D-alanine carboxypeptidase family protein n=1 Tax=Massilimicrobiota timonensis TaxID=1776392 RepID=UPI001961C44D|nr:D-alanyl-D-alanine carboxypeptidase family protein [Massilimicrobiota timonensis]MBM6967080.1 D-alanyl-D-alanine carboxypeptidase family protein [Massilimicrobiota timonensis]